MAPVLQSILAANPAATTKRRIELKMAVLSIRGPYSIEITRPSQQIGRPSESFSVCRPKPPVSLGATQIGSKQVSFKSVPKELQTSTTTTMGSCQNNVSTRTGSSTWYQIGQWHLLQLGGASGPAMKSCLIIKPLHGHALKKNPDSTAAMKE
ncbi:uncharacterized protein PAE49_016976 isoform 1-T1 [Odontesthes bonariensis]